MNVLHPNPPHASTVEPSARPLARPAAGAARPLAFLLLAAAVAALAVAADLLMTSWADEHLLATWIALWAVVFAGILTLAGTARRMAQRMALSLDQWARQRATARAQARAARLAHHQPGSAAHPVAFAPATAAAPWHGMGVVDLGKHRRHITFHV